MKKLLYILAAAALAITAATACDKYDDSELRGKISNLEDRVDQLEWQMTIANSNIEGLKKIVASLEGKIYITSVTETSDGYEVKFSNNTTATIRDGKSPVIGVKKDADGIWYWTLDGEWLKDGSGNKLAVTGNDGAPGAPGADAVAPQLKIEGNYWYISTDGGATWTQAGWATGNDGKDGDSMFQSVSWDESFWYFALANGDIIKIGRGAAGARALVALPYYSDGAVMATDGKFELRFNVLPEEAAEGLAALSTDVYTVSVAYTALTKTASAGDEAFLPVISKVGRNGRLILTVDATGLDGNFINGVLGACACLSIVYDDNVITTGYFPLRYDPYGGHGYVDLGLPSGTKWATCNVGASRPEEYGDYFAWGETEPEYEPGTASNPVWKNGGGYDDRKFRFYKWFNTTDGFTKYVVKNGIVDNKTMFSDYDYEDDAARANWGSKWRTPSPKQFQELCDIKNCDWTWAEDYEGSGINGYVVSSKIISGRFIFLPAAGYSCTKDLNKYGLYWTDTANANLEGAAFRLLFTKNSISCPKGDVVDTYARAAGLSVRPVCD